MKGTIERKPFWKKFIDRDFAYPYAERLVKVKLANQFRYLRGELNQAEFAKILGTRQSKISERFENPEYGKHSLKTLFERAKKLGLLLDVELKSMDNFYRDNHDILRDWFDLLDFEEAAERLVESKSTHAAEGSGAVIVPLVDEQHAPQMVETENVDRPVKQLRDVDVVDNVCAIGGS